MIILITGGEYSDYGVGGLAEIDENVYREFCEKKDALIKHRTELWERVDQAERVQRCGPWSDEIEAAVLSEKANRTAALAADAELKVVCQEFEKLCNANPIEYEECWMGPC